MMTTIAHMRANRKSNKGFSLVELIIVIAIMVALIAVLGPQYVKYVQNSRNTALKSAADDFQAFVKSELAEGKNLDPAQSISYEIKVTNGKLSITEKTSNDNFYIGSYSSNKLSGLLNAAGVDADSSMGATSWVFTITVTGSTDGAIVKMVQSTTATAG